MKPTKVSTLFSALILTVIGGGWLLNIPRGWIQGIVFLIAFCMFCWGLHKLIVERE